ncbi:MAG TPA: 4Fe-4S ferredoxin [Ruminiclostridium sp.]|nr:4Fe-4S ferredoxin [Ruminiclostridium sp.]
MPADVLFTPMAYSRYEASQTLPEKFSRLLKKSGLAAKIRGKKVAIKMHVGDGVTYSTIPPVFVCKLVDFIQKSGGSCFITDHYVSRRHPERRGYTDSNLNCPVLDCCGYFGKYYYTKNVDFKTFKHVDIAGLIHDADFLIDFSHVKGHGSCGYGGACKNIAMGCVTDRTRHQIHGLEGGLVWDQDKCIHCHQCLPACNHRANSFSAEGKAGEYQVDYHNCTLCQHCVKVCPTNAITLDSHDYADFQMGMAISTKTVLDTFEPGNVYYINVLTSITAVCDCWGLTTPSLVPDIGIMASNDIVAVERASLDAIKMEDLIPVGIPQGFELTGKGHLFEQLHGKNPYIQLEALEKVGLGNQEYQLITIS